MRHHHFYPIYQIPDCNAVVFAGDMSEGMDTVSELKLHYLNKPTFWVNSHTNFSRDYVVSHTRVIRNPQGYDWGHGPENPNWNPNLVVEI